MPPPTRHRAKRIVLYNHKGGVGKTILTANIASALAELNKKVLIIDSDPQTNLTSYFFEDSVVDDLLENSDSNSGRTIWTAMKPIATMDIDTSLIQPYETSVDNLLLIPGDIRLSEFEEVLNFFWGEAILRHVIGYKGVNALSIFINELCHTYNVDFVFYDAGPNIGPLNRIILLDSDYFIVPAACDLFSRRALKTLGYTLVRWIRDWETVSALAPSNINIFSGKPKFLGFIPQRFRVYGGVPTRVPSNYIAQIEKAIFSEVITNLKKISNELAPNTLSNSKLGEIRDFSTIVELGQSQGVPMWRVDEGNAQQKAESHRVFRTIAQKIINKTS